MFPGQRLAIAVVVTLLVIFGIYRYGFHNGWTERDVEMQQAIAKKNEEARATERRLTDEINSNAARLQEANHALNEKTGALNSAIRAGRVRLPAASCVQPAQGAAAPAGDRDEAPSESDRQTLLLIAAIAADGDAAINQLNACIDAYNQVREQLNGDR